MKADVADRAGGVDLRFQIHRPVLPAIPIAAPVLGRIDSALTKPAPPRFRPERGVLVAFVFHELEIASIGDGIAIDEERRQHDLMTRSLVVVSDASVVRSDGDGAAGKSDHFLARRWPRSERARSRRPIRVTLFQLQ